MSHARRGIAATHSGQRLDDGARFGEQRLREFIEAIAVHRLPPRTPSGCCRIPCSGGALARRIVQAVPTGTALDWTEPRGPTCAGQRGLLS